MEENMITEACNDMINVINDIMAHWYELINTFINTLLITINFCNLKKMYCALIFIISNHYGRKHDTEACNDMINVINDIMAHWYELINTFINTLLITINFCNLKKMYCALMFIISNDMEEKVLVTYYS